MSQSAFPLAVRDLKVRYGNILAVQGVSFEVAEGRVVSILGANGAGKSSTLNAICGNVRATISGRIELFGESIASLPTHALVQRGLVLVPEGREIIAPLTVEENLQLAGYGGRSPKRWRSLIDEVFHLFPILATRRATFGGLLSGGEQQMLAFGRALMSDPKVIVMDEPSMGLSPAMVTFIMQSIRKLNERQLTMLIVEQNANAALRIADYAYLMERGRIVHHDTAARIRSDAHIAQVFLGLEGDRAAMAC